MAKIFLSHSKQDEDIKDIFFRGFSGTGVHATLKEYEDVSPLGNSFGQINRNMAEEIENDILMSAAIFVVLSETVQRLQHTAQWIVWECAQAKAKQKPIWIFEPFESLGKIAIAIPHFNHYVRFQMNDEWRKYIHNIVASYNDTPVLMTAGGAGAGLWLLGGLPGVILGGIAGHLLSNKTETPKGFPFICDQCLLSYEVHVPGGLGEFRCACCNKRWLMS